MVGTPEGRRANGKSIELDFYATQRIGTTASARKSKVAKRADKSLNLANIRALKNQNKSVDLDKRRVYKAENSAHLRGHAFRIKTDDNPEDFSRPPNHNKTTSEVSSA